MPAAADGIFPCETFIIQTKVDFQRAELPAVPKCSTCQFPFISENGCGSVVELESLRLRSQVNFLLKNTSVAKRETAVDTSCKSSPVGLGGTRLNSTPLQDWGSREGKGCGSAAPLGVAWVSWGARDLGEKPFPQHQELLEGRGAHPAGPARCLNGFPRPRRAVPLRVPTAGRDAARHHPKTLGSAHPHGCELDAGHGFSQ